MDRRSNNIAIFQDSMDLIKANQKLQQAVQFSIQNQKLYVPSQAITLPEPGKSPCKTIVSSKRSFESRLCIRKSRKTSLCPEFRLCNQPRRWCNTGKHSTGRMSLSMQHTLSMPGHRNDVASVLSTASESRRSTL